jgi:formylglycine-generating enzyme
MRRQILSLTKLAFLASLCLVTPALAVITTTDSFGSSINAFTMDFVTIGNPGNPADTTGAPNPAGSVAYTYRMGSYEVSEDMINKANAAGSLGITKDTRGVNKVATSVSWNEAARFVNYLNVSSGSAAAYKFSTQPGDVGYGVNASITLWAPGDVGYDITNPFRNSNAKYFLPSENEWYKAAYYSSSGTYSNYATGSDTIPTAVASGTVGGTAVYGQSFATGPADITSAGGLSPYGTMGQGGNAFEWMETEFDGVNNSSDSSRGLRGGSWNGVESNLRASNRNVGDPAGESFLVGFRVASVPEPTSLFLTMLAGGMMLARRKR